MQQLAWLAQYAKCKKRWALVCWMEAPKSSQITNFIPSRQKNS